MKARLADLAWRWAPRLMIEQHLARRKATLEPELWIVDRLLRPGERAIDIGANRGVWSLQLAKHAAQVEAFEPNPQCLAELKRVIHGRIRLHEVALSDGPGAMTMRFDPDNTGIGTIEQANSLTQNAGIRRIVEIGVPVATLDSFRFEDVGLIKIDVEGHEEAVLAGGAATIKAARPALIIESEERHNPGAPGRIERMLTALGYAGFVIRDGEILSLDDARARGARPGHAGDVNNFVFVDPTHAAQLDPPL